MIKWLIALLCFSLVSYVSYYIPPETFWPAALFSLALPVFLVLNTLFFLILLVKRSRLILFPIIGLTVGASFAWRTFRFHKNDQKDNADISVLSFNAKLFRKKKTYEQFSSEMIDWVVNDPSKIKCIQEYSTNNNWEVLDVTGKLEKQGYYYFAVKSEMKNNDHNNGIGIFSRYKIVNKGVVEPLDNTVNGVIYADLDTGNDTLRVYNVHLQSLNLKNGGITEFVSRLKDASIKRSSQARKLIKHTDASPYPFIICGDFNETPYSYNYDQLQSSFCSSFENAGSGFGFSLNSLLFFLRIDHQFYSKNITITGYEVNRKMDISDHFPTFGYYKLKK